MSGLSPESPRRGDAPFDYLPRLVDSVPPPISRDLIGSIRGLNFDRFRRTCLPSLAALAEFGLEANGKVRRQQLVDFAELVEHLEATAVHPSEAAANRQRAQEESKFYKDHVLSWLNQFRDAVRDACALLQSGEPPATPSTSEARAKSFMLWARGFEFRRLPEAVTAGRLDTLAAALGATVNPAQLSYRLGVDPSAMRSGIPLAVHHMVDVWRTAIAHAAIVSPSKNDSEAVRTVLVSALASPPCLQFHWEHHRDLTAVFEIRTTAHMRLYLEKAAASNAWRSNAVEELFRGAAATMPKFQLNCSSAPGNGAVTYRFSFGSPVLSLQCRKLETGHADRIQARELTPQSPRIGLSPPAEPALKMKVNGGNVLTIAVAREEGDAISDGCKLATERTLGTLPLLRALADSLKSSFDVRLQWKHAVPVLEIWKTRLESVGNRPLLDCRGLADPRFVKPRLAPCVVLSVDQARQQSAPRVIDLLLNQDVNLSLDLRPFGGLFDQGARALVAAIWRRIVADGLSADDLVVSFAPNQMSERQADLVVRSRQLHEVIRRATFDSGTQEFRWTYKPDVQQLQVPQSVVDEVFKLRVEGPLNPHMLTSVLKIARVDMDSYTASIVSDRLNRIGSPRRRDAVDALRAPIRKGEVRWERAGNTVKFGHIPPSTTRHA